MSFSKFIRTAGVCLVAVFAVSLVASATASAVPTWKQCSTEKEANATKWKTNKCNEAEAGGAWNWRELTTTEKVASSGKLKLIDTKFLGEPGVECTGTNTGTIGPKQYDRTETIQVSECKSLGTCTTVETVRPIHLPWQTELFETEGRIRDKLTETGNGQPGWEIGCNSLLGKKIDTCETEAGKEGSTLMENQQGGDVIAEFDPIKSGKAKCSLGGTAAGKVEGKIANWAVDGHAISVS